MAAMKEKRRLLDYCGDGAPGTVDEPRRLNLGPSDLSEIPDALQQVSIDLLTATKRQIGSVAPLQGGTPKDPPKAQPPRLQHNQSFGARQPHIESPRGKIALADPRFTSVRLHHAVAEIGEARSPPCQRAVVNRGVRSSCSSAEWLP
jgi:hypothetical protein